MEEKTFDFFHSFFSSLNGVLKSPSIFYIPKDEQRNLLKGNQKKTLHTKGKSEVNIFFWNTERWPLKSDQGNLQIFLIDRWLEVTVYF